LNSQAFVPCFKFKERKKHSIGMRIKFEKKRRRESREDNSGTKQHCRKIVVDTTGKNENFCVLLFLIKNFYYFGIERESVSTTHSVMTS
jgi:hypothetical protein